jgi:L-fuculose-phosphate aldolase
MSEVEDLKQEICEIGRRMYCSGFVAANDGNISVRLGADRYLCTPTGVSKGFMTHEMICLVDDEGHQLEGELPRTSEILLHLEFFHALPEINAVTHAHPPHATAFAVAGISPPVGVLPEAEILLGPVPLAEYATPGTQALADSILPHLQNKANTILLANHGVVSCDKTLEKAYFHLETVDAYCRTLILARQIGRERILDDDQVQALLDIKRRMGIDDPRIVN